MRHLLLALCLFFSYGAFAQAPHGHIHNRAIHFPDTENYRTLVCDFHIHTVFSDGSVWPTIRVEEALRDSVDAIATTEHLEYQPKAADLPHPDRNRAYAIAEQHARPYDLLVIPGAEITRDMPPGHSNAIFIEDANRLLIDDSLAVFEEANRQGAFTFWNHPNWIAQQRDGIAQLTDFHRELIEKDLLHGIEVANEMTISEEALQIALDHDLAIMGTSDIHGLVDWQFRVAEGGHRPVTLVLAEAPTAESIKEALFARRTVAWFENTLVGREPHLRPIVEASLRVEQAQYQGIAAVVDVTIYNDSDAEYILVNESPYTLHAHLDVVTLAPNGSTTISVKTREQLKTLELNFTVLNAVTAPGEYLKVVLPVTTDL
jgi:predicted metal-dependent phosphoesterase TrpH